MKIYPIFLSIIIIVRNQSEQIERILLNIAEVISPIVSDYELIIVDNASNDDSVACFRYLTREHGHPNLQVYALTKEVNTDIATWVGLENALGDFVGIIDPLTDDINFLPEMLDKAVGGTDVVFANNKKKPRQSLTYILMKHIFNQLYKLFNDINLTEEAPNYRILSRTVINFILQHPQPAITYRHLPATGGFSRSNLNYTATPNPQQKKRLGESIDRGMRLLVSTTRAPMRIVTSLSMFGAFSNLAYSIYVLAIGLLKTDIAPGWISLSLQQSGMFFLISIVLLVLGEYILNMVNMSNEGPLYHVGQEFTSADLTRHEKLNIEEVI